MKMPNGASGGRVMTVVGTCVMRAKGIFVQVQGVANTCAVLVSGRGSTILSAIIVRSLENAPRFGISLGNLAGKAKPPG